MRRTAVASVVAGALAGVTILGAALATDAGAAPAVAYAPTAVPTSVPTSVNGPPGAVRAVLTDPTADGHAYRHGARPRLGAVESGAGGAVVAGPSEDRDTGGAPIVRAREVTYGGGLTAQGTGATGSLVAAGVTTGQPRVYLVFMGAQWGAESTIGTGGDQAPAFSGDPDGEAPYLARFFEGLGTDGEQWSEILTGYCDGAPVGADLCAPGTSTVPYPTGDVLAGAWEDTSPTATSEEAAGASGHDLAEEAESAAAHFGNLDQASNRDAQYVIASPTGTDPDGWASPTTGYCAYHDDSHDPALHRGPADGPIVAFTNLPYQPDAGAGCGEGSVNTPGVLDGVGESISHEYAETVSDQFPEGHPAAGWTNAAGAEIGDLCENLTADEPGGLVDLQLATGSFAVQGLWSNLADDGRGACVDGAAPYRFGPVVEALTPADAAVGSTVTVTGFNLAGRVRVTVGGVRAPVTADSATSLALTVPSRTTGGAVTVVTPAGTATGPVDLVLAPTLVRVVPASGPPGRSVTIVGHGLGEVRRVTIGGRRVTIVSVSADRVVVTVRRHTPSGAVAVVSRPGDATGPVFTVS